MHQVDESMTTTHHAASLHVWNEKRAGDRFEILYLLQAYCIK